MDLKKLLKEKILLFDGGTGTWFQRNGIRPKNCFEELNLIEPATVKKLHRAYLEAGSDIILTNTFGGNPLKLANFGLADKTEEINAAAVKIIRSIPGDHLVALNLAPLGKYLQPVGKLTFDEAYQAYVRQIKGGIDADIIYIETISDTKEFKAAMLAAKDVTDKPIIAQMTFEENGRTTLGTDVRTFIEIAQALGPDVIGMNCTIGPEEYYPLAKILAKYSCLPICVKANAGMPILKDGMTSYEATPDLFYEYGKKFADLGVNILGGCCGTGPEHIAALKNAIKDTLPKKTKCQASFYSHFTNSHN